MFSRSDFCNPELHGRPARPKRPLHGKYAQVFPDLVSQEELDVLAPVAGPDSRELYGIRRVICMLLQDYCPFRRLARLARNRVSARSESLQLYGLRGVICAVLQEYCPFQRLKRRAERRAAAEDAKFKARVHRGLPHTA